MRTLKEVVVEITADTTELEQELKRIKQELSNVEIKDAMLNKAMDILNGKHSTPDELKVALELIRYAKTLP